MEGDEIILIVFFSISLVLLVYSLGASVTGYAMKNMYCDQEWCDGYCRFNSDCRESNKVCCEENGFGVCKSSSDCQIIHEFNPESDISPNQMKKIMDKPTKDYKKDILMYGTLMVAFVTLIAFHYKKK